MDLRRRLARMEMLAAHLCPDPRSCPTCGAPVPSIPSVVHLGSDGSIREGGMLERTLRQCDDCGGYGGRAALALDHETGAHRGILIVLPGDDEADRTKLDLEGWLGRYDGRELGRPWDDWLRLLRGSRSE